MSERETAARYVWVAFNHAYGPWHRLRRVVDGVRADMLVPGWKASAIVQPDMDGQRFYWHVLMQRKGEEGRTRFGREILLADAKSKAEEALEAMQWGGAAGEEVRNSTAATPPSEQSEGPPGMD